MMRIWKRALAIVLALALVVPTPAFADEVVEDYVVPEALTPELDDELYGMDRMVEALDNAAAGSTPWELMSAVRSDIDDFIGDAEQFDDLTMLCLRYNGKKS